MYRSIQNQYRQTFILRASNSNYRYRIVLPEEDSFITETDLWECWQRSSHCRCKFSLEVKIIPLQMQTLGSILPEVCNHVDYNGSSRGA